MAVGDLLNRLETVRHTGPGRWVARCPAHEDKHPSLAIRELEDGRVLVHDFAGCPIESVLEAVGLEFDVLFPDRPRHSEGRRRERHPFNARDVLSCVSFEVMVTLQCAKVLSSGRRLSEVDQARLLIAVERLSAAESLVNAR